jgi:hypothetical protein
VWNSFVTLLQVSLLVAKRTLDRVLVQIGLENVVNAVVSTPAAAPTPTTSDDTTVVHASTVSVPVPVTLAVDQQKLLLIAAFAEFGLTHPLASALKTECDARNCLQHISEANGPDVKRVSTAGTIALRTLLNEL